MVQTNDIEWVFIVLHSGVIHYQIYEDARPPPRTPRWVRFLVKLFAVGKTVYRLV